MQVSVQLAFNGQRRPAFERYKGGTITVMNTSGGSDAKLLPGSNASADSIKLSPYQGGA